MSIVCIAHDDAGGRNGRGQTGGQTGRRAGGQRVAKDAGALAVDPADMRGKRQIPRRV